MLPGGSLLLARCRLRWADRDARRARLPQGRAGGRGAGRARNLEVRRRRACVDLLHGPRACRHGAADGDRAGSGGDRAAWPDGPSPVRPTLPSAGHRASRGGVRQPDRRAAARQKSSHDHGTTLFLDLATLEPYEDQWDYVPHSTGSHRSRSRRLLGAATRAHGRDRSGSIHGSPVPPGRSPRGSDPCTFDSTGGSGFQARNCPQRSTRRSKHAASVARTRSSSTGSAGASRPGTSRVSSHTYEETKDGRLVVPRGLLDTVVRGHRGGRELDRARRPAAPTASRSAAAFTRRELSTASSRTRLQIC